MFSRISNLHRIGLLAGILLLAISISAADWPQWRGPNRDGSAPDASLPSPLPKELKLRWKVEVGEGYSSPVIMDERVYMMVRRGEDEVVICLDAKDGKEIWAKGFSVPFKVHPAALTAGPGPKATCLLTENLVIAFGITELFVALDRNSGELIWKHDFHKQFNPAWPETGTSGSPIRIGDTVVVPIGTKDKGGPAAFDLKTGKIRWQLDGDGPSYAAPDVFEILDSSQIITFTQKSLLGIRSAKGKMLWSLPFETPYGQNIVEPILIGNRIIYTGVDKTIQAVDLAKGPQGNFSTSPAWENKDHSSYMSQPVLIKDHVLFHSEKQKGMFVCLNGATGALSWESPPRMGDYVSFSRVGDTILALHNDATLRAIKARTDQFEELAHWTVADGETWAWPAFLDSRIFVKDVKHIYCWSWSRDS